MNGSWKRAAKHFVLSDPLTATASKTYAGSGTDSRATSESLKTVSLRHFLNLACHLPKVTRKYRRKGAR